MPLPLPNQDEPKDAFISRCIETEIMNEDFPNLTQRIAVCVSQWDNKDDIETVLINSNFSCNYFIDRDKLAEILKYQYHLHVVYDPCSYPGIQCKFYYNEENDSNNGICSCEKKCSKKGSGKGANECLEISFMVFRTGSVLIVGHCDEEILHKIYKYVKMMLIKECPNIAIPGTKKKKQKNKKVWKKTILISV